MNSQPSAIPERCMQADQKSSIKMNTCLRFILIVTAGFLSCKQSNKSTSDTDAKETINSVRNYEYADSTGKRITIHNSLPKSNLNYTDPSGKKFVYAVFWTQIVNKTTSPIDLKIDFPLDSFEFPFSSGNYMSILIPSETMTPYKEVLPEYGLDTKSFLDSGIHKSHSLKRTINPKDSSAFYIVTLSTSGVGGALRTGLSFKGQNLIYKLALFNNSSQELQLMSEKEINCGIISLKGLTLQK